MDGECWCLRAELWQSTVLQGSADLELCCREHDLNLDFLGFSEQDDGAQARLLAGNGTCTTDR